MTFEDDVPDDIDVIVDLDARTLYVSGEVTSRMAHQVIVALERLNETDGIIRIVLNSEGGDEQAGYAIYDAIRQSPHFVSIDGYGSVMSMAAIIFQAADYRRLSENALYMIHNGSVDEQKDKQDDIIEYAKRLQSNCYHYYSVLVEASGQPFNKVEEWCVKETFFSAPQAVEVGFADEVIKSKKQRKK